MDSANEQRSKERMGFHSLILALRNKGKWIMDEIRRIHTTHNLILVIIIVFILFQLTVKLVKS
jgi:hypothetical protein